SWFFNRSRPVSNARATRRSRGRFTQRARWRLRRVSSLIAPAAVFLVGADDALDERMADHVVPGEFDDGDALDVFQRVVRFDQSGMFVGRQIDLRDVTGDDSLGAVAETGEEHKHLLGRGVLSLGETED